MPEHAFSMLQMGSPKKKSEVIQNLRTLTEMYGSWITDALTNDEAMHDDKFKAMSMQSGYSSSALHERIYSSENMCGILIYTGAADKEGSLGGLVELGGMNKFLPLLKGALENGLTCTTDPECFMKNPTSERLNGAACHSCTMISETACENGNRLLDRALVVPVPEHEEMGYFRELVRDLCGMQV